MMKHAHTYIYTNTPTTAPLFTESATDREMNAVNAEDSKNRINDFRRYVTFGYVYIPIVVFPDID